MLILQYVVPPTSAPATHASTTYATDCVSVDAARLSTKGDVITPRAAEAVLVEKSEISWIYHICICLGIVTYDEVL